jgi:predicted short-subunit dehydrogenase-like oxidoreductase (DUF2520 family)
MNEIKIRMLYHIYGGDTIKIGFIGPGKVGVSLGRYFTHKGMQLSGFYGRNENTAKAAAHATKSKFYKNIHELIKESNILFITTPDDSISIIDNELSKFDLKDKSICHASGSLQSNVLYNAKNSGALIYSVHPIFAFSSKNTNLTALENIYFSIEGDIIENSPIIKLFNEIGNRYFIRNKIDSSIYHLANVLVSNLTLSLLDIGTNYLMKLGLNEEDALNALKPLIKGNIDSICDKGFSNSLTGPIVRGDLSTVKKHLSVLDNQDQELYKRLSINLLKIIAFKETKAGSISLDVNNDSSNEEMAITNLITKSSKHLEIYNILEGVN